MNISRRPSPNLHVLDLNRPHIRERGGKNRTDKTRSKCPVSLRMCQHVAPYAGVEIELVQQAIASDPVAQDRLYRMCTPKLYRTAFAVLRNKEDAEDTVQEAWLRAYNHLKSFQGRSSFSTWMTRIVLNSALMVLRKKRSEREAGGHDLGEAERNSLNLQLCDISANPELIYGKEQRKNLLSLAVANLRPRLRRVLQAAQLGELSLKETAHVLGISVNAVKDQLFHARAALRKSPVLKAIGRVKTGLAA
jgi:RNA polymerase sigma-70 factor (ECF subfamily)